MTLQQFVKFMQNNPLISLLLRSSFRVIYVCGGPGSGKGTVCEAIAAQTNSVHVSSGDLLRQEVEQKTSLGNECAELMQEGKLVDASIVLALLEKFLITHPGHYAMLDGFPRSLQNAEDFHDLFGPPACVLMFDCPDEVMVERIVERGRTSGRADDNETTAHERVKVFHAQSQPSMQFLQEQHVPVYKLDATAPKETVINEAMQLPMFKKGMFDLG
jgi:adenylate kinase